MQAFPSFPASKLQLPHPGKGANSGNSPAPAPSINIYVHLQIPQDCRSQSHLAARGCCLLLPPQAENAVPEKALTMFTASEPEAGVAVCAHRSLGLLGGPRKSALPHLGQAALHGTASSARDASQDHHTDPRDHSPIPGIITPLQGLFPSPRDCFSIKDCSLIPGPHRTSSRDSTRRGGPGKSLQWGSGNVAKQLLPARDSSVPQRLCQITRINTAGLLARELEIASMMFRGQGLHGGSILLGTRPLSEAPCVFTDAWKQLPPLSSVVPNTLPGARVSAGPATRS